MQVKGYEMAGIEIRCEVLQNLNALINLNVCIH